MPNEREQQIDDRMHGHPGGTPPAGLPDLIARAVDNLETPEQQRAAAACVVEALPAAAKRDLAAQVVHDLDTSQQRAAAEGVIGAISSAARQDLAASVVRALDTVPQQRAAAERVVDLLPADQQQRLAEGLLGRPDGRTRQRLWYMIVGALSAAIFVFGLMAFVLIYQEKAAEAPLALATTALGGIVGLIATSPGGSR